MRALLTWRWLVLTVVAVVAVVVMLNLARWQWDRHLERQDRNDRIEEQLAQPVLPVGDADTEWAPVSAEGTWRAEDEVLISNRTLDGMPGWWVLTPLEQDDGSIVAVVRGWVPLTAETGPQREAAAPPEGRVRIVGVLQDSQERTAGPLDQPGVLPRVNLSVLAERMGEDVEPRWIQLVDAQPLAESGLPVVLPEPELGDGPHLNYTGQWLIFATLTLVVYVVLAVRAVRRREPDGVG